jgi:hypothetical protein
MSAVPQKDHYEYEHWAAAAAGAWEVPSWKTAAREYHETRGNRPLIVEIEPERLVQLRCLLMGSTSLERAWGELSTARSSDGRGARLRPARRHRCAANKA